ncbi:9594_t:CDS:10 [Funneliformis caledonium]|uniref:Guanine nucleotide-binding protein-like 1 n=1 Tax=Funneliformis caledonium TaxID=1117310 RepID=A0A9N9AL58_9GLOM|nr:9594_t:CDS:10 [Funneliformis caledonium]
MGNGHRKKPFSGKQKKKQLLEKRAKNASKTKEVSDNEEFEDIDKHIEENKQVKGPSKREQLYDNNRIAASSTRKLNNPSKRLHSVFEKLSSKEIKAQRKASMNTFARLPSTVLEVSVNDIYKSIIDFPKRPSWNYEMTKEELEANEEHYFQQWLDDVYDRYPKGELSFFEHNLDVWRQLWRVLEISDIILIVVDIRHPLLHFPPSLYNYVVKDIKRKMLLVDLVAENTVYAWTKYFEEQFPELGVVKFSCYPRDNKFVDDTSTAFLKERTKRPKTRRYLASGIKELLIACENMKLVKEGVDVSWMELVEQYNRSATVFDDISDIKEEDEMDDNDESREETCDIESLVLEEEKHIKRIEDLLRTVDIQDTKVYSHNELITIGLVGHPNVGKSSLINSILGRTVVSVSKTPGHTKHFQTIHLSKSVRICDSPGLVFPSLLPKQIQILSGMYPISQAERIPLESLLKLDPPEQLQNNEWSAWYICEAFAIKRGYYTKASRPDVYRAANAILRLINDGRILLSFKPPGFFTSLKYLISKRDDVDLQVKNEYKKNTKGKDVEFKSYDDEEKFKGFHGGYFGFLEDSSDEDAIG